MLTLVVCGVRCDSVEAKSPGEDNASAASVGQEAESIGQVSPPIVITQDDDLPALSASRTLLLNDLDIKMSGLAPDLLLSFSLAPGKSEIFYDDVEAASIPLTILGGFSTVVVGARHTVTFSITDPTGRTLLRNSSEGVRLFQFVATVSGTYIFAAAAPEAAMEDVFVTIAVGREGKAGAAVGSWSQLQALEAQAATLEATLREAQLEASSLWVARQAHLVVVEGIDTRLIVFGVFQAILLVAMQCYVASQITYDARPRKVDDADFSRDHVKHRPNYSPGVRPGFRHRHSGVRGF